MAIKRIKGYKDAGRFPVPSGMHGHALPPKKTKDYDPPEVLKSACAGQDEPMPKSLPVR